MANKHQVQHAWEEHYGTSINVIGNHVSKGGFSVRILLQDGEVDGVQYLEVANWTGVGILAPRDRYNDLRREDEFARTGIYILTGPDPQIEGATRAYIGRAEQLRTRIDAHAKERDWWDLCLCFTTSDNSLTQTHIQFLEAALLQQAIKAGQVHLENTQYPDIPRLKRADSQDLSRFLETMLLLSGMAGFSVFEIADQSPDEEEGNIPATEEWKFAGITFKYSGSGGYDATARYEARNRFVVNRGSEARIDETGSCPSKVRTIRKKLREDGVLVVSGQHLVFATEHAFNSPSLAAGVVYGGSANGRSVWTDQERRQTINDLDEIELEAQEADETMTKDAMLRPDCKP